MPALTPDPARLSLAMENYAYRYEVRFLSGD